MNMEVIETFREFGGCRLEDDVVVTATGIENFTVLPSEPDEIEHVMASSQKK